ncbi:hypothetical protein [Streptomyces sp. FH025]|uniref:hypothetical protein n=1 Tax=Streptomyces sp. FH025 TaxID=2815937 RepID=UPI001A9E5120|nr:hypothetical protein [Streptomyces sp. FH025]MBO1418063.1 hypothetical protein [Streptomyces sp. FH025]
MPGVTDFLARITELATNAGLGELRYDAALPELAAHYGDPWDGGPVHRETRWPHAFGWGDVQTVFCQCRQLRSLSLPVWHGELELPRPGGGSLILDTRVHESALTAALSAAGLTWQTVTYENVPGQRTLEVSPAEEVRVALVLVDRIGYDEPPLEDWLLYKAVLWGYDHVDCPEPDGALPDDGWGAV